MFGIASTRNKKTELIDTCWDVNEVRYSQTASGSMELIDTCWDVNLVQQAVGQPRCLN